MLPDTLEKQRTETPYAIVKLGESVRVITQAINELPSLRKRLDKHKDSKPKAREIYRDLQQLHSRLLGALNAATLLLLEMELPDIAGYSAKLSQSIGGFNLMTPDYTKLCAALRGYLAKLPITAESKTTNASVIGRLMNNVKMGYYPTDLEHIGQMVQGIEFPDGVTTNVFDPCCGCGLALRTLAQGNNCYAYGVELDRYRAEEAQGRLHRVGFGSYFHSRISHEAFHVMLLNPPYLSVMTEGGNNTRSEKRFLVDSLCQLMYGGLLIYIIPYYRLTPDICRVLCDNFDDLTVWKFAPGEFSKFKQIAVMGIRRKRADGSAAAQSLAAMAFEPDKMPDLFMLPENRYQLPAVPKKVDLFKGAEFNVAELAEQLKRSTSFSKMFEKSKLDSEVKRPLLPLNIGQVGLIGGSGLINGLVECDTPHIIKGRIVKENSVNKEENLNSKGELTSTTLYETRSNKMIFNLLTPQGFITLTDYASGNVDADSCEADGDLATASTGRAVANMNNRLPLGQVVVTANAKSILSDYDINSAIARHQSCDWGDTSKADWDANDSALKNGDRILSTFTSWAGDKFWVITEWDRSYTTVLMPDDY